jgi:hypothetical protein
VISACRSDVGRNKEKGVCEMSDFEITLAVCVCVEVEEGRRGGGRRFRDDTAKILLCGTMIFLQSSSY